MRPMPLTARALLFDMDGLMIDSEPIWHEVERDFARSIGVDWTAALAHECIGKGLPNTIRTMQAHGAAALALAEGVERLVTGFLGRLPDVRLQPGCSELIHAAHGALRLAVASSSTRRLVDAVLAHFALTAEFAAVVSGESVVRLKPAPDVFLHAAALLGCEAADCVVLEDSAAGVRAACAAGMRVIAVPETDPTPFRALTEHVVPSLREARELLGL